MYDKWIAFVTEVAKRTASRVARYGWTVDDCTQHAAMALWRTKLRDVNEGYLTLMIRRSIVRAASTHSFEELPKQETAAKETVETWVEHLIEEAEGDTKAYLFDRFVLGLRHDAIQWNRGWNVIGYHRIRNDAAAWVMAQLEGRKCK